jgi:GNAT superfamily N-acetyltransferase
VGVGSRGARPLLAPGRRRRIGAVNIVGSNLWEDARVPEMDVYGALEDGTRIHFRPIRADDKQRLAAGFNALSPTSRYRRFFRHIDHLSESQLRYLTEVDGENHVAWLAVLPDFPGEPGVGVGRWIRLSDDPAHAEAAVTVLDEYQHKGLGKALLYLLARSAIERGLAGFRAWVLGDNQPMFDLLKDMGALPGHWEEGVYEVTVPLPDSVEKLEATAAPRILRAVAAGHIQAEAQPDGVAPRFGPSPE